jgi:hypothetical protein
LSIRLVPLALDILRAGLGQEPARILLAGPLFDDPHHQVVALGDLIPVALRDIFRYPISAIAPMSPQEAASNAAPPSAAASQPAAATRATPGMASEATPTSPPRIPPTIAPFPAPWTACSDSA